MKRDLLQGAWMLFLFALLIVLAIWAVGYVDHQPSQIQIFGIIAVIVAAFTSVLTVSINNRKAKEREYELLVLKEKQKVYEHFYNSLFEAIARVKKDDKQIKKHDLGDKDKAMIEMMAFKRGLMNWGSEHLIVRFLEYEKSLLTNKDKDAIAFVNQADKFLKEIRREMGYEVSDKVSLISILLTAEAREELKEKLKKS